MRASVVLTCYCWLLVRVSSIHPECRFHLEIQEEETKCAELLSSQTENQRACSGVWDNITCWRPADVGETVTVPCPKVFSNFYSRPGNISKNCTSDGWSETFPDFIDACGYNDPEDESKDPLGLQLDLGVDTCGEKGKVDVIVTQVYGQISSLPHLKLDNKKIVFSDQMDAATLKGITAGQLSLLFSHCAYHTATLA